MKHIEPLAIHIPPADPTLTLLAMGGANPQGRAITVNQKYITFDERPWLPVMGEFHFSRYPHERWETELMKMKAGGITVISSYLFWIHIEETEGLFLWNGNNNLRKFVDLCGKHSLYTYLRIGPWAHGECRNGGFPDWLLKRCGSNIRQDAQPYLTYVTRFYTEIYRQVQGLLWKDSGPIIGIQLENELVNNAPHIATLKRLACQVGFDVPLYTVTGWGPAEIPEGEVIPIFGGYPDTFWDRQVLTWSRDSRKHYFFSKLRDDNTIGADLNKREDVSDQTNLELYPYGTCELAGGMQVAYHRRPRIEPDDIAAMALVKTGNGNNLQGYYMYHGGSNPLGQYSTMQESQTTGYWNDLPVINYDFQAGLGQYGQVREGYHRLRVLNLFLQDFGEMLAPLPAQMPEQMPVSIDDRSTLRWSVRSDGQQGFLFFNNYQRIEQLEDHQQVQFQIALPDGMLLLHFQPIDIPSGKYGIWPINFNYCGVRLRYATLQPICRLVADLPYLILAQIDGIDSEVVLDVDTVQSVDGPVVPENLGDVLRLSGFTPGPDCRFVITSSGGQQLVLLILSQSESRRVWKAQLWGQERLILSQNRLHFSEGQIHVDVSPSEIVDLAIFPAPDHPLFLGRRELPASPEGLFQRFQLTLPEETTPIKFRKVQSGDPAPLIHIGQAGVAQPPDDNAYEQAETWEVNLPMNVKFPGQVLLSIDYNGNVARAYLGDVLVDDDFWYGRAWEIDITPFLPKLAMGEPILLRFLPLQRDAPIYLSEDIRPMQINTTETLEVRNIEVQVRYSLTIRHSGMYADGA